MPSWGGAQLKKKHRDNFTFKYEPITSIRRGPCILHTHEGHNTPCVTHFCIVC